MLTLHLLDEIEQAAVVGLIASDEVGSTAQHMMAVLRPTHEGIEFLATVATAHYDGLTPCLAYGVEELVYEYVQQVVSTLCRAVVDALALRCGAGAQFI